MYLTHSGDIWTVHLSAGGYDGQVLSSPLPVVGSLEGRHPIHMLTVVISTNVSFHEYLASLLLTADDTKA